MINIERSIISTNGYQGALAMSVRQYCLTGQPQNSINIQLLQHDTHKAVPNYYTVRSLGVRNSAWIYDGRIRLSS